MANQPPQPPPTPADVPGQISGLIHEAGGYIWSRLAPANRQYFTGLFRDLKPLISPGSASFLFSESAYRGLITKIEESAYSLERAVSHWVETAQDPCPGRSFAMVQSAIAVADRELVEPSSPEAACGDLLELFRLVSDGGAGIIQSRRCWRWPPRRWWRG